MNCDRTTPYEVCESISSIDNESDSDETVEYNELRENWDRNVDNEMVENIENEIVQNDEDEMAKNVGNEMVENVET